MLDTLANLKTALLVSGTADDSTLARLQTAADSFIAEYTGRAFAGGTFTETHPAGGTLVFLRRAPTSAACSSPRRPIPPAPGRTRGRWPAG